MSKRPGRDAYKVFYPISTRWSDNDTYGHINNVIYYSYFDSVANRYLIEEGGQRGRLRETGDERTQRSGGRFARPQERGAGGGVFFDGCGDRVFFDGVQIIKR